MSTTVVGEFETKAGAVRATLSDWRGRLRADIRLWVEPRESPGSELVPTAKGLSVPIEYADDLLELVLALSAAAQNELRDRQGRRSSTTTTSTHDGSTGGRQNGHAQR